MWDLSFPAKVGTHATCSRSIEAKRLDQQGHPSMSASKCAGGTYLLTTSGDVEMRLESPCVSPSVMPDSLWPRGLQHARPPRPSPAPRAAPRWSVAWSDAVHRVAKSQTGPSDWTERRDLQDLAWWLRWWRICLQRRRPGFDPWVRKIPWEGNGYPLQYSGLENPMDRGAWWATLCGAKRVGHDWGTNRGILKLPS